MVSLIGVMFLGKKWSKTKVRSTYKAVYKWNTDTNMFISIMYNIFS